MAVIQALKPHLCVLGTKQLIISFDFMSEIILYVKLNAYLPRSLLWPPVCPIHDITFKFIPLLSSVHNYLEERLLCRDKEIMQHIGTSRKTDVASSW